MIGRARLGERAADASTARLRDRPTASRARTSRLVREHWTAAGLFALVVFLFLAPALLGGHPLLPAAALYRVAPWSGVVPSDVLDYYNIALLDVPASYFPWDVLAREYIHAGTFPAWNPYAFAGTPFFGNPEVAWLSPFSLPLWILPLTYGLGVAAALKLWIGALGTYLYARELRLDFAPGLVAGLSFAFCTFNVVWLSHGVHVSVAVMLPWAIWLAERIVRRGRPLDGLALVGVVALVLTGGHPGTQLHVLAAVVIYTLVRSALLGTPLERSERLRRLGLVGCGLALGTLLAAPTLLPAQQAALDTVGAAARRNGGADFPGAQMSFGALRAVLFPEWWGRPSEWSLQGPGTYYERALFAGTIPFALALVALASRGSWRVKGPLALLGAVGLAVGLRAPGIRDAIVNAPLFDRVQDQRMLLWFLFAVAILAAYGLQAALDGNAGRRRAWAAVAVLVVAAAVAAASVPHGSEVVRNAWEWFLHRSGKPLPSVQRLANVGWLLACMLGLGIALLVLGRRPRWRTSVGIAVALLVAFEMLHFAHGFQPMGPASRAIPPRTPAIAFLQQRREQGRIAGVGVTLENDWTTIYRLRDVRGYDAPQPSARFHALWLTMSPLQRTHTTYAFAALTPESQRVLSLLGVRWVFADPGTSVALPRLRSVYEGADGTVFENRAALARVFVARRVHAVGGLSEEVATATEAGFDPRRDVVVRRDELPSSSGAAALRGGGSVRVTDERNARVALRARLTRPSVVLLDDAWAPGWSVRIDGRPAHALQADVVLRGVVVPAGEHEVVWSYRVPGLRAGIALGIAGLLGTLAWAAVLLLRARRARRPPVPAG